MENINSTDLRIYFINLEEFGEFEIQSNDIFYALDVLKNQLKVPLGDLGAFKILNVWIQKEDKSRLEITSLLNP